MIKIPKNHDLAETAQRVAEAMQIKLVNRLITPKMISENLLEEGVVDREGYAFLVNRGEVENAVSYAGEGSETKLFYTGARSKRMVRQVDLVQFFSLRNEKRFIQVMCGMPFGECTVQFYDAERTGLLESLGPINEEAFKNETGSNPGPVKGEVTFIVTNESVWYEYQSGERVAPPRRYGVFEEREEAFEKLYQVIMGLK